MMDAELEKAFHAAMLDIYKKAKSEASYNATRFLSMVSEQGGLATAKSLIRSSSISEGYTALWERGRLDLTVENLVLQPRWQSLFSDQERATAAERLREYGFSGEPNAI